MLLGGRCPLSSNGYMGLALFDAALAPLHRYPSAPAGHNHSVSATVFLTGAYDVQVAVRAVV